MINADRVMVRDRATVGDDRVACLTLRALPLGMRVRSFLWCDKSEVERSAALVKVRDVAANDWSVRCERVSDAAVQQHQVAPSCRGFKRFDHHAPFQQVITQVRR